MFIQLKYKILNENFFKLLKPPTHSLSFKFNIKLKKCYNTIHYETLLIFNFKMLLFSAYFGIFNNFFYVLITHTLNSQAQ